MRGLSLRGGAPTFRAWGREGAWPGALKALALLWATILLLFHRDVVDLVTIWLTSSTFEHCLFIPFLIAWLVHLRAPGLRAMKPVYWRGGALWLGLGALAWVLGEAAGVGMVRQGALVMMLQGATAACLGAHIVRALAFPFFYAFFMVPFGEEIVAPLQLLTAHMAVAMLDMVGIPAYLDGIFITTPTGYFEVAEACSGAKFVIAMLAYGVLVCHVCFRSWWRRGLFLSLALAACVAANGVRAFGTIYVAHYHGIHMAVGMDHVIWGWLFFAIVMTLVMAVAWPFFDRRPAELADVSIDARGRSLTGRAIPVGALMLLLLAAPGWSAVSAWNSASLPRLALPQVAGWQRSRAPMAHLWEPRFTGADYRVQGRYADARGHVVDLVIATYARQSEGRELVGFGQGAVDLANEWVWSSDAAPAAGTKAERITAPGPVVRNVVSLYRVGAGGVTGNPVEVKLDTLRVRLLMSDQSAVAMLISAEDRPGRPAGAAIAAFVKSLGAPEDLADASLGRR